MGLLASILLPVFGRARQQTDVIKTLSNMRQVGVALLSYANDNNYLLPNRVSDGANDPKWPTLLYPCLQNPNVYYSPIPDMQGKSYRVSQPSDYLNNQKNYTSYIYNGMNDLGAHRLAVAVRQIQHHRDPLTRLDDLPASLGVISDTHGLLRPEVVAALRGTDAILHAGDVGKESVLAPLAALAPLTAIRGNVDRGPWAQRLPLTETVEVGGVLIYMIHDVHDLDLDPRAASVRVVISGHSHQPSVREERGVLYLNPGSAGPRRFKLPVSVARLEIDARGQVTARLIELSV